MEIVLGLFIYGFLSGCVGLVAQRKGRNYLMWGIISFVFTPLIGIIVLLAFGDTDEMRRAKIREEEEIRKSVK